jgi:hypothetical protein
VQGKNNTPADALSQHNDDERQTEERTIALIPPEAFLNLADTDPTSSLEYQLSEWQQEHQKWIEDLSKEHQYWCDRGSWKDPEGKLVIPSDNALKRWIMHAYHNGLSGHPGRDEMVRKILGLFSWPGAQ